MHHANDDIIKALRAARRNKQLSQRELSAKAGVPQSHISKIENGGSDIRLSSLIELARALELELLLVPRRLMPAVQGILRSVSSQSITTEHTYTEIREVLKTLAKLSSDYPGVKVFNKLMNTVRDLGNFRLSQADIAQIALIVEGLNSKFRLKTNAADEDEFAQRALTKLSSLRNQFAHALPPPPRRAYSVEDDDDA